MEAVSWSKSNLVRRGESVANLKICSALTGDSWCYNYRSGTRRSRRNKLHKNSQVKDHFLNNFFSIGHKSPSKFCPISNHFRTERERNLYFSLYSDSQRFLLDVLSTRNLKQKMNDIIQFIISVFFNFSMPNLEIFQCNNFSYFIFSMVKKITYLTGISTPLHSASTKKSFKIGIDKFIEFWFLTVSSGEYLHIRRLKYTRFFAFRLCNSISNYFRSPTIIGY